MVTIPSTSSSPWSLKKPPSSSPSALSRSNVNMMPTLTETAADATERPDQLERAAEFELFEDDVDVGLLAGVAPDDELLELQREVRAVVVAAADPQRERVEPDEEIDAGRLVPFGLRAELHRE